MNQVILIGNLTRDTELSTTNSGIAMCKFSVAVSRKHNKEETDFFNIVTWRGLAENCNKYLKKGSKVAISGSIQNSSYDDKDGTKRTYTSITADDVEFLSSKNTGETSQEAGSKKQKVSDLELADDDDLPF